MEIQRLAKENEFGYNYIKKISTDNGKKIGQYLAKRKVYILHTQSETPKYNNSILSFYLQGDDLEKAT